MSLVDQQGHGGLGEAGSLSPAERLFHDLIDGGYIDVGVDADEAPDEAGRVDLFELELDDELDPLDVDPREVEEQLAALKAEGALEMALFEPSAFVFEQSGRAEQSPGQPSEQPPQQPSGQPSEQLKDAAPGVGAGVVVPLSRARERRRRWIAPLAVAAAGLLVAGVVLLKGEPSGRPMAKGDGQAVSEPVPTDRLYLAVRRDGVTFRAEERQRVNVGDRIRFFYSTPEPGAVALFFIDAEGEVALLYPTEGKLSAPIAPGDEAPLDAGARVTAGEGCEWVVGVFTSRPVVLAELRDALTRSLELEGAGGGAADCRLHLDLPQARSVNLIPLWQAPAGEPQ